MQHKLQTLIKILKTAMLNKGDKEMNEESDMETVLDEAADRLGKLTTIDEMEDAISMLEKLCLKRN